MLAKKSYSVKPSPDINWPFPLAEPMDTESIEVPSPPSSQDRANINSLPNYTMKASIRGIGVIINNKNFTNGIKNREGTDVDAATYFRGII